MIIDSNNIFQKLKDRLRHAVLSWQYYIRYAFFRKASVFKSAMRLRGSKGGRSVFVFATGPSINLLDPNKLKGYIDKGGYDVIAVNNYIKSKLGEKIPPNYMVLSDPTYFDIFDTVANIITEEDKRLEREVIARINTLNIPTFIPLQYSSHNKIDNYICFNDNSKRSSTNVTNIEKSLGFSSMTAYKALSIALYMGYERVYVCGIDNSNFLNILIDSDNNIRQKTSHCYDDNPSFDTPMPDFVSSTSQYFLDYAIMFSDLEKFSGFKIVNLDPNGFVDCFSKRHNLDIYNG